MLESVALLGLGLLLLLAVAVRASGLGPRLEAYLTRQHAEGPARRALEACGWTTAGNLAPWVCVVDAADYLRPFTRSTGLALSYNLSVTLFGGFAPLIATSLIAATGDKLAPSYYVIATAALSVAAIAILAWNKTRAASG